MIDFSDDVIDSVYRKPGIPGYNDNRIALFYHTGGGLSTAPAAIFLLKGALS